MRKKSDSVYQFKIILKEIEPAIWRRIQVPETYTFWDLHVAIQDAMGWTDTHLHHFEIVNPATGMKEEIGIPDDDLMDTKLLPGWKRKIAEYFSSENARADYVYDYGDYWEHGIRLEKILRREKGVKYPVCIDGARACPPEDCGGPYGYQDFLEAIMNPDSESYEEMLSWAGGKFDPEDFEPEEIIFDDPRKRLKSMLAG